jgi:hypothetical protein
MQMMYSLAMKMAFCRSLLLSSIWFRRAFLGPLDSYNYHEPPPYASDSAALPPVWLASHSIVSVQKAPKSEGPTASRPLPRPRTN